MLKYVAFLAVYHAIGIGFTIATIAGLIVYAEIRVKNFMKDGIMLKDDVLALIKVKERSLEPSYVATAMFGWPGIIAWCLVKACELHRLFKSVKKGS